MSVTVVCDCQSTFELKDEFAGTLVQCPNCGTTRRAGPAPRPADPAFDRDLFLMRQEIAISERYVVSDDQGNQLLYVVRPAHFFRNMLAIFGGFIAMMAGIMVASAVIEMIAPLPDDPDAVPSTLSGILALVAMLSAIAGGIAAGLWLSQKRHVTFYRGSDESAPKALEIIQNHKVRFPTQTYTVRDETGRPLGVLSKNYLYNLFRKQWEIRSASGRPLSVVKEDSIILSLLRRFLGPLFGVLRTNFVFFQFGSDRELGEFKRKMTLLDRYVFDMSADRSRTLDRRLAVAAAVMLDSAERR
jgi:hypothetical protein